MDFEDLEMGEGEGNTGARALDETPTWAVGAVCAAIILISIILEKVLHRTGEVYLFLFILHYLLIIIYSFPFFCYLILFFPSLFNTYPHKES